MPNSHSCLLKNSRLMYSYFKNAYLSTDCRNFVKYRLNSKFVKYVVTISYRSCNNTSIVEANSNIWICNIFFVPHTVFNIAHKIISVWQITSLLNIYFQFTMEKMAF